MTHTIELDPGLEAFVQKQIAAGRYESADQVIETALRMLQQSNDPQMDKRLLESLAQARRGEVIDADVVFDELEKEIAEIARSRAK